MYLLVFVCAFDLNMCLCVVFVVYCVMLRGVCALVVWFVRVCLCVVFVVYCAMLHGLCVLVVWFVRVCCVCCLRLFVCFVHGYCVVLYGLCVLYGAKECFACIRVLRV